MRFLGLLWVGEWCLQWITIWNVMCIRDNVNLALPWPPFFARNFFLNTLRLRYGTRFTWGRQIIKFFGNCHARLHVKNNFCWWLAFFELCNFLSIVNFALFFKIILESQPPRLLHFFEKLCVLMRNFWFIHGDRLFLRLRFRIISLLGFFVCRFTIAVLWLACILDVILHLIFVPVHAVVDW